MPNNIAHFAIHADEPERAKRFYEQVFGWRFEPWGPPDFWLVHTGDDEAPGILGSLQVRQHKVEGDGIRAFECTVSVADVDATAKAVEQHGGRITTAKTQIPTVGWLIRFDDTEGNVLCAMRYDQASV